MQMQKVNGLSNYLFLPRAKKSAEQIRRIKNPVETIVKNSVTTESIKFLTAFSICKDPFHLLLAKTIMDPLEVGVREVAEHVGFKMEHAKLKKRIGMSLAQAPKNELNERLKAGDVLLAKHKALYKNHSIFEGSAVNVIGKNFFNPIYDLFNTLNCIEKAAKNYLVKK